MSLKSKLEALIYAAEEPISLDQMLVLLKDDLQALKSAPAEEPPGESHLGAVEHESGKRSLDKTEKAELRSLLKPVLEELIADYSKEDRGIEIRQVAGGYRMSTKPEHHDVVRSFAKSLKPPIRLSLQALETLSVIAYKQPVTVPEISEIRGVDASGVIGTLLDRKLITTAGRKDVIGRPILYKTTKEFLLRFGLKDVNELPSMEEFEKLVAESFQSELMPTEIAAQTESAEPDNRQPAEPEVQAEPVAEPLSEAPEQTVEEREKPG